MRLVKMLLFFCLFLIIAFFMIKNRRTFSDGVVGESEIVIEKQDITSDVEIDFNRYMVERQPKKSGKTSGYTSGLKDYTNKNLFIPDEMDEIIKLIKKGELVKAMDRLEEMEKVAGVGTLPWIFYFKGHLFFMNMNFSKALEIFQKFLEEYPGHELESNVSEAVSYLEGM